MWFQTLSAEWVAQCEAVIVSNSRMCLQHPEVFGDVNSIKQFMDIYMQEYNDRGIPHFVCINELSHPVKCQSNIK